MTADDRLPVIVVGAGLAGLTCARLLAQTGTPVVVLEAADGIGGRVRTDITSEGFVLDRGFQVVFTAYPALRRVLDLPTLDLRRFDNGAAVVVSPGRPVFLRDPTRHPEHALAAITSRLLTWGDRARLARLALSLAAARWDGVRDIPDTARSIEQELRVRGFSDQLIEAFFRPFLAGIRLCHDLSTSAAVGLFDLKMLVRGHAALPARGMQALPEALAADLPPGAIHLDTPVLELMRDQGRQVLGVRTPHGELRGSAVVLAADGDSTARLTGLDVPRVGLGSATLYLAGRRRLYAQKLLALNALPDPFVNDATLLTNVVPEYAPAGWHLLAAHVLESDGLDDGTVEARARADLSRWFPHVDLASWRTLAVVRTPRSQFLQPPHAQAELPSTRTRWSGLYLAGEITEDSSINGAIRSGESAARIVASDLRTQDSSKGPEREPGEVAFGRPSQGSAF